MPYHIISYHIISYIISYHHHHHHHHLHQNNKKKKKMTTKKTRGRRRRRQRRRRRRRQQQQQQQQTRRVRTCTPLPQNSKMLKTVPNGIIIFMFQTSFPTMQFPYFWGSINIRINTQNHTVYCHSILPISMIRRSTSLTGVSESVKIHRPLSA
jgi:hypothetical protein